MDKIDYDKAEELLGESIWEVFEYGRPSGRYGVEEKGSVDSITIEKRLCKVETGVDTEVSVTHVRTDWGNKYSCEETNFPFERNYFCNEEEAELEAAKRESISEYQNYINALNKKIKQIHSSDSYKRHFLKKHKPWILEQIKESGDA